MSTVEPNEPVEPLPPVVRRLLERPLTGVLATVNGDGSPQATPVWFDFDGAAVKVSITRNRHKYRNLTARPVAAFTIVDPDNPMRYAEVRGPVTVTDDPDYAFRTRIGERYGIDAAAYDPPGAERVVVTLVPTRWSGR